MFDKDFLMVGRTKWTLSVSNDYSVSLMPYFSIVMNIEGFNFYQFIYHFIYYFSVNGI